MAAQVRVLLALLLLACVCTVHGENGAGSKDVCTRGMAALEVFSRFRGCGKAEHPRHLMRELMRRLRNVASVDDWRRVVTYHCSTVIPRVRQCFERNIRGCSADQQRSLMAMAQHTGIVCQPNSSAIFPQIAHMLSKLSDDDLAENPSCNFDKGAVDQLCHNRSLVAVGLPSGDFRLLEDLTLEELARKVQLYFRRSVQCTVRQIRDDPSRCQQWRGLLLRAIDFVFWPVLGNTMTFTNQEIDRAFEWE